MNENENVMIKKEKQNNNYTSFFVKIIIVILLMGSGAGICYYVITKMPGTTIVNRQEKEVTITDSGIADAVEKIYDSVVVVENYQKKQIYATGSGFVFEKKDDTYYIMTNYHVISDATNIKIRFTDETSEEVELIGGDKYSDIAVLALKTKNELKVAELGKSKNARVGDTLFAIGAPLDSATYSWTVTRGVLSGKDRMVAVSTSQTSLGANDYIMKVLQTDAAINSGNSGGALCNSNGQVIGITNMKLVSSGVEGMGFAIPIEDAYEFSKRIINGEDITRPLLGVTMVELAAADYYGLDIPENAEYGVIVYKVQTSSSADEAGIKSGDIIVEFDGNRVTSSAQLKYELYRHNVGEKVNIKINRDGIEKELEIKLKK